MLSLPPFILSGLLLIFSALDLAFGAKFFPDTLTIPFSHPATPSALPEMAQTFFPELTDLLAEEEEGEAGEDEAEGKDEAGEEKKEETEEEGKGEEGNEDGEAGGEMEKKEIEAEEGQDAG